MKSQSAAAPLDVPPYTHWYPPWYHSVTLLSDATAPAPTAVSILDLSPYSDSLTSPHSWHRTSWWVLLNPQLQQLQLPEHYVEDPLTRTLKFIGDDRGHYEAPRKPFLPPISSIREIFRRWVSSNLCLLPWTPASEFHWPLCLRPFSIDVEV